MLAWWKYRVVIKKIFLITIACCTLLGLRYTHSLVMPDLVMSDPAERLMASVFAQDTSAEATDEEAQPDSPLDTPEAGAASQPKSPLSTPKSNEDASQPESPIAVPEKVETPEPTATPDPTATMQPTATALPTKVPTTTPSVTPTLASTTGPISTTEAISTTETISTTRSISITESTVDSSEAVTSTSRLPLINLPNQAAVGEDSTATEAMPVAISGSAQSVQEIPAALSDISRTLISNTREPIFLTENLVLALLCLITLSVMWLGLCALSVCIFYIRSRQAHQIRDYSRADRHMIVHYRR